ncbi:ArsR family transcriptional regulator [Sulfidibacter corallicola]|uniref:ArsR family transcriptional regulator n=1 Tax=Sulfidibacter corallicola TaxID=2818388 RepID=A0A8A4TNE5_SULCO|nr:ArsR family transcriptional regulator [Sulfidibacter corallicola]QTD50947.1 ArsR family transcriptional regulator [Sulfidibacter corallicola]
MTHAHWNQSLLGPTRWQLVCHLRRKPRHVKELAELLGVTSNAIRPHLVSLERDRLVRVSGRVQSGGKPALVYEITEIAEQLFPKAFGLILKHLVASMRDQLEPDDLEQIVADTACRLARLFPPARGSIRERMNYAVEAVIHLGGLAELEETERGFAIQGYSCPLAEAADCNPEVCRLAAVLLGELTGLEIAEVCDKEKVACRFEYFSE